VKVSDTALVPGRGGETRPAWHGALGFLRRWPWALPGVLAGLIVVCIYLALTEPIFLHWDNWRNIIRTESVVLTLGIG
jgi:hypothetical protein